jgi:DNA primase large subunit
VPPGVFSEEIIERSIKGSKNSSSRGPNKNTIAGSGASKSEAESTAEPEDVMMVEVTWMQLYLAYMVNKTLPEDVVEARRIVRQSKAFVMLQRKLYKKSITGIYCNGLSPLKKGKSY